MTSHNLGILMRIDILVHLGLGFLFSPFFFVCHH